MKFINTRENPKIIKEIKKLYFLAFPKEARSPFLLLRLKTLDKNSDFSAIYDNDTFVGFIYSYLYKDLIYVLYFAIDEKVRSNGYGSKALDILKEKYSGKRICLNIEAIDDKATNAKQRIKRKEFYLKNEFKDAFVKTREGGLFYELLTYNGDVSFDDYFELMGKYAGKFFAKCTIKEIKNSK